MSKQERERNQDVQEQRGEARGDQRGAVPGITVSEHGSVVVEGRDAIGWARLCALRGAIRLEAMGMRHSSSRSRGSVCARVKKEFGITGSRSKVLAFLEALIESERERLNAAQDAKQSQPSQQQEEI
jgi:hypothetical protein